MHGTTEGAAVSRSDQAFFNALVVEDDPITARLLQLMLDRRCGAAVRSVESAEQAWAVLTKQDRWDLILIDIGLPGASGLDLLRASKQTRPDIPHVILTGRSDDADVRAAHAAGADDYLVKPVATVALGTAVARALTRDVPVPTPVEVAW